MLARIRRYSRFWRVSLLVPVLPSATLWYSHLAGPSQNTPSDLPTITVSILTVQYACSVYNRWFSRHLMTKFYNRKSAKNPGLLWNFIAFRIFGAKTFCVFSALTLSLLIGRQDEHPACKNWVMRCWCGYLFGVRCSLFAYDPADATASQILIISRLILMQTGFIFLVPAYPDCSVKEAVKWVQ